VAGPRPTILTALVATCLLLAVPLASTAAVPGTRSGDAAVFAGVGSWVDIFAKTSRAHPRDVIASLRRHGVATLYLQTSNYSQHVPVVGPSTAGTFIDDAHAAGIQVVAGYLPSLVHTGTDFRRALAAMRFRSSTGQTFDAFALDIEASVVRNVNVRNSRLLALSRSLRSSAPVGYPLGAIVPSPVGMRRHPTYWPHFPFAELAKTFDTFLPMAYFSYYAKTPPAAYAYAHDVIEAIRAQSAQPHVPIHIIGGIASAASLPAVTAFMRAAGDCNVVGISLYAFAETSASEWSALGRTPLSAGSTEACPP
jgi:hypothetical protein